MRQSTSSNIAKVFAITSCSALSVLAVAPAQAVVMTFENLAVNNASLFNFVGTSITENDFNITVTSGGIATNQPPQYRVYGTQIVQLFGGSTAIFSDSNGTNIRGTTYLTQVGGGAFNLSSIDLNTVFNTGSNLQVTFVGTKADNTPVSQTFGLDGTVTTFEKFNFNNDFTNLVSVNWQQTLTPYLFDNINVSAVGGTTAVPEPFTILGTVFGVGSGVVLKRKLAKAQADK